MAPFVKADNLTQREVERAIESFVYGVNIPSRWGTQSPFSNITLDWTCPERLKNVHPIVGGVEVDFTFGDCKTEMDMVNKAFIQIMTEGDSLGRGFAYPIPTYNITKDFEWETENAKLLFIMTGKYGTPYFQNFINSDLDPDDVRSMAILPTQKLLIKDCDGIVTLSVVKDIVENWNTKRKYTILLNGKWIPIIDMFEVPYRKYPNSVSFRFSDGTSQPFSWDHKTIVYRNNEVINVLAQDVLCTDHLLVSTTAWDISKNMDATLTEEKFLVDGHLNNLVWNCSIDARRRVFDNLTNADYKSEELLAELKILLSSIGELDNEQQLLTRVEYNGDSYLLKPITNVEIVPSTDDIVYNFTVDTPEHIYELPNGIITHQCCRLRLDKTVLRKRGGGLFGSDELTGSIGVVTIDLPRIGYTSTNETEYFDQLAKMMDIAAESLIRKRKVLQEWFDHGIYPYSKVYLENLNNHFNTIGIVGMHESILNFFGPDTGINTGKGQAFALKVLNFMRTRMEYYQTTKYSTAKEFVKHVKSDTQKNVFGFDKDRSLSEDNINYMDFGPFNLEASPAESTSYRLALHDKKHYPDIITSGSEEDPYYTNSTQLPVDDTYDIFDAMSHQDPLQVKYTGGTVFHGHLQESIADWRSVSKLVKSMATNFKTPYYTISPVYSICPVHGYISGEHHECPKCQAETEVYARIVGYYRPVKNWNKGKKAEKLARKEFNLFEDVRSKDQYDELYLYTKELCPNCPAAKKYLDDNGIDYMQRNISESDVINEEANDFTIEVTPSFLLRDSKTGRLLKVESLEEFKNLK